MHHTINPPMLKVNGVNTKTAKKLDGGAAAMQSSNHQPPRDLTSGKRRREESSEERIDSSEDFKFEGKAQPTSNMTAAGLLEKDHHTDGSADDDDDSENEGVSKGRIDEKEGNETDGTEQDMFKKFRREKRLAMNRASARARRRKKKVMLESLTRQVTELTKKNQSLQGTNETLIRKIERLEASLNQSQETIAALLDERQRAGTSTTSSAGVPPTSLFSGGGLLGNIPTSSAATGLGPTSSGFLGSSAAAPATDPYHSLLLRGAAGVNPATAAAGASAPAVGAPLGGRDLFYRAALQQHAQLLALQTGQQQQPLEATGLSGLARFSHLSGAAVPDHCAFSVNPEDGAALSSYLFGASGQIPPSELSSNLVRSGVLYSTAAFPTGLQQSLHHSDSDLADNLRGGEGKNSTPSRKRS